MLDQHAILNNNRQLITIMDIHTNNCTFWNGTKLEITVENWNIYTLKMFQSYRRCINE